jgi:hypothetical protein
MAQQSVLMTQEQEDILNEAVRRFLLYEQQHGTKALKAVLKQCEAIEGRSEFHVLLETRLNQRLTKKQIDRMYAAVHKNDVRTYKVEPCEFGADGVVPPGLRLIPHPSGLSLFH